MKSKNSEIKINSNTLYEYFVTQNHINDIKYLKNNSELIIKIKDFLKIQKSIENNKFTLLDIHLEIISLNEVTLGIWKDLLIESLEFLGFNETVGIKELYNYQKEFMDFEEVLHGSINYYREHINHSINLFLIGEMLFREKLKYKHLRVYTTGKGDIESDISAIFCFIAMTHDLGYPIEKYNSTNKRYVEMFKRFKNLKITEQSIDFPISYQNVFDYLIYVLSFNLITDSDDLDKTRIKIKERRHMLHVRPNATTALIDYNHGLFSCLKLIEHLRMFKENYNILMNSEKNDEPLDVRFLICQRILKTIFYHSAKTIKLGDERLLPLWFILIDDLCVSSRLTKGFGYSKVTGFYFPTIHEFNIHKVEITFEFNEKTPNDIRSSRLFQDMTLKYYQIINQIDGLKPRKIQTNIIINVKDPRTGEKFTFSYQYKNKQIFNCKIKKINLTSKKILKLILNEELVEYLEK